jgi:hypothetical protein
VRRGKLQGMAQGSPVDSRQKIEDTGEHRSGQLPYGKRGGHQAQEGRGIVRCPRTASCMPIIVTTMKVLPTSSAAIAIVSGASAQPHPPGVERRCITVAHCPDVTIGQRSQMNAACSDANTALFRQSSAHVTRPRGAIMTHGPIHFVD